MSLPADAVPIIYLPGVSRPTLRATDECPPELSPLAELQYRGVFWSQNNGKDWTVTAFLQAEKGGLNLRIARDNATLEAIHRAFDKLVDEPVADLLEKSKLRPLDSHDFDKLIVDDPVDDLLTWLSDPQGTRQRWEPGRWEALSSRCKTEYGFDPQKHGELEGAERLGRHAKPAWKAAWNRFTKAPGRYPGLVALLKRAKPKSGDLLEKCAVESWPQDNEAEEAKLRQSLHDLTRLPVPAARKRVLELDQEHGMRRDWVWAKLGQDSPGSCSGPVEDPRNGNRRPPDGCHDRRRDPELHGRGMGRRCGGPGCPGGSLIPGRPCGTQPGDRPYLQPLAPRPGGAVPGTLQEQRPCQDEKSLGCTRRIPAP